MKVTLSPREREALTLYASGFTGIQVANRMGVGEASVHGFLRRVRTKYRAAGRPVISKLDLRDRAVEDGLIDVRGNILGANNGLLGPGAWSPATSPTARKLRILYRPTGCLA